MIFILNRHFLIFWKFVQYYLINNDRYLNLDCQIRLYDFFLLDFFHENFYFFLILSGVILFFDYNYFLAKIVQDMIFKNELIFFLYFLFAIRLWFYFHEFLYFYKNGQFQASFLYFQLLLVEYWTIWKQVKRIFIIRIVLCSIMV